mmetsp:Transcript_23861/g.64619  ORF Transcript_23861/g.64619 Transcript_23861/m.64619 type:complete len:395 (+) Transcript_23861:97-1281(+)
MMMMMDIEKARRLKKTTILSAIVWATLLIAAGIVLKGSHAVQRAADCIDECNDDGVACADALECDCACAEGNGPADIKLEASECTALKAVMIEHYKQNMFDCSDHHRHRSRGEHDHKDSHSNHQGHHSWGNADASDDSEVSDLSDDSDDSDDSDGPENSEDSGDERRHHDGRDLVRVPTDSDILEVPPLGITTDHLEEPFHLATLMEEPHGHHHGQHHGQHRHWDEDEDDEDVLRVELAGARLTAAATRAQSICSALLSSNAGISAQCPAFFGEATSLSMHLDGSSVSVPGFTTCKRFHQSCLRSIPRKCVDHGVVAAVAAFLIGAGVAGMVALVTGARLCFAWLRSAAMTNPQVVQSDVPLATAVPLKSEVQSAALLKNAHHLEPSSDLHQQP